MFTHPVSSPPPGTQAATPVSPSRQSRLRGLSYLRNYTHNHLLSRDGGQQSTGGGSASTGRSGGSLTRSVSYSHTATATATVPAGQNPNRLTLVSSTPSSTRAITTASPPEPIPETTDRQPGPPQA
ncbi:Uncharacterized protein TCAP_02791, partial [Tolypocladium capitatum]